MNDHPTLARLVAFFIVYTAGQVYEVIDTKNKRFSVYRVIFTTVFYLLFTLILIKFGGMRP